MSLSLFLFPPPAQFQLTLATSPMVVVSRLTVGPPKPIRDIPAPFPRPVPFVCKVRRCGQGVVKGTRTGRE